jgi:hypothetical protein
MAKARKPTRAVARREAAAASDDRAVPATAADACEVDYETAEHWVRGGLFAKGGKPGPGRPKGSLNKTTAVAKQAIIDTFMQLQALHPGAGTWPDFLAWAQDNKTEFYRMFARLAPLEVDTRGESIGLVIFKGLNG